MDYLEQNEDLSYILVQVVQRGNIYSKNMILNRRKLSAWTCEICFWNIQKNDELWILFLYNGNIFVSDKRLHRNKNQ